VSNTLTITLSSVAFDFLLYSALVAFSFPRLRWPGRNLLFFLMLSTMMLPYQVTIIALILFRQLGSVNTLLPLIVPVPSG
jgi:multiple sugar transport system permease protein